MTVMVFNLVHRWITYALLYTEYTASREEHQGSPIYGYPMSTKLLYMLTERDMKQEVSEMLTIYMNILPDMLTCLSTSTQVSHEQSTPVLAVARKLTRIEQQPRRSKGASIG